jgi:hypothetical protein
MLLYMLRVGGGPLTLENVGFPSLTFGKRARERDGFCVLQRRNVRLCRWSLTTRAPRDRA